MRRFSFLILLFVAMLFVQTASAAISYGDVVYENFPEDFVYEGSSYNNVYDGSSYYNEPHSGRYLSGRIDFAVYYEEAVDEYVYMYRISNDLEPSPASYGSDLGVSYFCVKSEYGDEPLNESTITDIGSHEIEAGDIAPSSKGFDYSDSSVLWNFGSLSTESPYIKAGERSRLLVFRSKYGWRAGDYEMGYVVNPEPCTLALLGFGSAMALRGRRKFIR